MDKKILLDLNDKTASLTLNRPEKRNALDLSLLNELIETLKNLPTIRTLFIFGKGNDFCTGMDLQDAVDPEKIALSSKLLEDTFRTLQNTPYITVACINGRAFGGGAGLALASDFILMEEGSSLAFPEVQRGLVPALVSALLKPKVPENILKELLLLGEPLSPDRALTLGLALKIAKKGELLLESDKIAAKVNLGGPLAIKETKALINALSHKEANLITAATFHKNARHSSEAKEGINAFFEKRPPSWIN